MLGGMTKHGGIMVGDLPLQVGPTVLAGMDGIGMMHGTLQHGETVL